MKVYTIATLKNECFGHGDYRNEFKICQDIIQYHKDPSTNQQIGIQTFHPVFKDKILAQNYLDEIKWNSNKRIIELELIES